MNKAIAILQLFPDTTIGEDFEVVDHLDGNGQIITKWELDSPIPSDEELEIAWESYLNSPEDESPLSEVDLLKQELSEKSILIEQLQTEVGEQKQINSNNTEAIMEISSMMASFYAPEEIEEEQPVEGEENV